MKDSFTGFPAEELKKFSDSVRTIAGALDVAVPLVVRAEAGIILKTWAGRTKVATEKKLERRGLLDAYRRARSKAGFSSYRGGVEPGEASINLGIRGTFGKVYYRTRKDGKHFQDVFRSGFAPGKRIRTADWGRVANFVSLFRASYEEIVRKFKASSGFSRQSVVQIADDLGIRLEDVKGGGVLSAVGLAKARSAMATTGQSHRNGYGIISDTAKEFFITLVNRYPKAGRLFMDTTLRGVIAGRVKYFERNLEEGTFLAAKKAAKAYPWVEVLRLAA